MGTFEIKTIPLSSLSVDGYQRPLNQRRVEEIADHFDLVQWNLPKVSGAGLVVVGHHRTEALRLLLERNQWPFDDIPAGYLQVQVVHLDPADEADLILDDISNVKPWSAYNRHQAALLGRKSPRHQCAVDVQAALDHYSIPLRERQRAKDGVFAFMAVAALNSLWASSAGNGTEVLDETLRLVSKWKRDDGYRFEGSLVGGLGLVVRNLLKSEGHTGRLERVVEKNTALAIATKAMIYAGQEQAKGNGRPSLSQPRTYETIITSMLPKAKAPTPAKFISRFPVAVAAGAIQV